jgi:hypothetical protein
LFFDVTGRPHGRENKDDITYQADRFVRVRMSFDRSVLAGRNIGKVAAGRHTKTVDPGGLCATAIGCTTTTGRKARGLS